MWDDIKIGTGNHGNSAIKIFGIEHEDISENSVSYWICHCICDTGMVVMKDTKEGQRITKLIEEKASKEKMQDYLDSLILKKMKVKDFKLRLKADLEDSYDRGMRAKEREIQNVLGLHQFLNY